MFQFSQEQFTNLAVLMYGLTYLSGFVTMARKSIKGFDVRALFALLIIFVGFSYVYILGYVGMEALRKLA